MAMAPMGGVFYQVSSPDTLIVDPSAEPNAKSQEQLRSEIEDYEDILAMDYKYCMCVEGASQESNLWIPRNQNQTGLADADLQRFKNLAWNECVVKKFLTTREGDADLVGRSMINIIQSLNLQWIGLHVMGLHPKIEAAEKQVVMSCMEESLVQFDLDVGKVSRSFRRCEHFSDFFANAVGGQIVANTGRTPGLSKTMYGTDMDYAYKNKALFHLQRAMQRNKQLVTHCLKEAENIDYVPRLTQLKIIRPEGAIELTSYDDKQKPQSIVVDQGRRGWDDGSISRLETTLSRKMDELLGRKLDETLLGKINSTIQGTMASQIEEVRQLIRIAHTTLDQTRDPQDLKRFLDPVFNEYDRRMQQGLMDLTRACGEVNQLMNDGKVEMTRNLQDASTFGRELLRIFEEQSTKIKTEFEDMLNIHTNDFDKLLQITIEPILELNFHQRIDTLMHYIAVLYDGLNTFIERLNMSLDGVANFQQLPPLPPMDIEAPMASFPQPAPGTHPEPPPIDAGGPPPPKRQNRGLPTVQSSDLIVSDADYEAMSGRFI